MVEVCKLRNVEIYQLFVEQSNTKLYHIVLNMKLTFIILPLRCTSVLSWHQDKGADQKRGICSARLCHLWQCHISTGIVTLLLCSYSRCMYCMHVNSFFCAPWMFKAVITCYKINQMRVQQLWEQFYFKIIAMHCRPNDISIFL